MLWAEFLLQGQKALLRFLCKHIKKKKQNKNNKQEGIASTKYANSGRRYGVDGGKYLLTEKQTAQVVAFVKKWRHKRFCTCPYIKRELKLEATPRTIAIFF